MYVITTVTGIGSVLQNKSIFPTFSSKSINYLKRLFVEEFLKGWFSHIVWWHFQPLTVKPKSQTQNPDTAPNSNPDPDPVSNLIPKILTLNLTLALIPTLTLKP